MVKQLSIFDVESNITALNLERASIKQHNDGFYTDVVVTVPKNAILNKDYETWEHTCYCLWKRDKGKWEEAVKKMEHCRDNKESIPIRIPIMKNGQAFYSPKVVVQYL